MLLVFYAAQHKNLTENVADICVWPLVYMDMCMYIDYNNKLTGTTLGLSWHNVKLCSVRAFKYPRILTKSSRNLNKYILI